MLWIRLMSLDLGRTYRAFSIYILALFAESALLLAMVHGPPIYYARVWLVTRLSILVLEAVVVLKIFRRWTASYEGIGSFGRKLVVILMAVSLALVASTLPVSWSWNGWSVALQLTAIANRAFSLCFAAFLLLMIGFFGKFGGPVAPNLKRHSWAMTAWVSANTITYFVLSSHIFWLANILLPSVSVTVLTLWIFAFRKSGEEQPVTVGDVDEWATVEALNSQLLRLSTAVTPTLSGMKKRK